MGDLSVGINTSELFNSLSSLPGVSLTIKILQTAGIIFIVYLVFLFIKGIIQYRRFSKINQIDKKLGEINQTLKKIDSKLTSFSNKKRK